MKDIPHELTPPDAYAVVLRRRYDGRPGCPALMLQLR
jgi:hypothetical protein